MAGEAASTACSSPREELAHLLHPVAVKKLVRLWLSEDTPSFDYGGYVVGDRGERASLLCKAAGVLAGCPFVTAIFAELGCTVTWLFNEGEQLQPICQVATIEGRAKDLLLGERVALNVLSRASGVATLCRRLLLLARSHAWHGEVAGTRKTTPGFRMVEKYAALVGGISTHRYDLSSMVMLKDNHIWAVGNIPEAVKAARRTCGFSMKIEVECRSYDEAVQAIEAGCDVVMLDNFEPEALHKTSKLIKDLHPNIIIEASGGINEENIVQYFGATVDVISLSRATQGYDCVDYSLKIMRQDRDPSNPRVTLSAS